MTPRTVVLAVLALGAAPGVRHALAQAPPDSAQVDQFRPPAAPAFVLLGVEPVSVERPSTPQGFAVSVVSATNQLTSLPRNYAIEVSPYWLARHPTLEFNDYYYRASLWQTLKQTLSLSFATVTPDTGSAGTAVGLGVRALLARGQAPDVIDLMKAVQDSMLDEDDPEKLRRLDGTQRALVAEFHAADLRRVGGRFEVAAAATVQFPSQRFENGQLRRLGIWTTYSYQLEDPRLDLTALARAMVNVTGPESGALFDFGSRLSLEAQRRLVVSLEVVGRAAVDATLERTGPGQAAGTIALEATYRAAGSAEYLLGNGSSVLISFGRDYSPTGDTDSNLIATVGVNLGFGVVPFVAAPRGS